MHSERDKIHCCVFDIYLKPWRYVYVVRMQLELAVELAPPSPTASLELA